MIRQTSISAIKDIPVLSINKQEKKILKYVMSRKDCTRHEIAAKLNMETSTISARVNSMLKWGVLEESHKRPCGITGRTVWAIVA